MRDEPEAGIRQIMSDVTAKDTDQAGRSSPRFEVDLTYSYSQEAAIKVQSVTINKEP